MNYRKIINQTVSKLKILSSLENAIKKTQRLTTSWEKMLLPDRGLVFRTHNEFPQLINKKTNHPILKWAKDLAYTSEMKKYKQPIST